MTLGTRWEMYKTSYEHLIVPESKDASRLLEPIQKSTGANLKGFLPPAKHDTV